MEIQLSDHFTIKKMLLFTLPMIGMMVFTSVYMMVDGFFVSNFAGKTAFAAVNLINPFNMILATTGFMFGAGGSALVAKTLGEGDADKANRIFSLLVAVAFVIGVIFAIVGLIFIRPITVLLGASGELLENCVRYESILLLVLPFFILVLMFSTFFAVAEKPQLGLYTSLLSGFTNILLDAILVTMLPQPYKLTGAAIATAASQLIGGLVSVLYFVRKNESLLHIVKFDFDLRAIGKVLVNGSSEFMSNISMCLISVLYNLQLLKYVSENGVAAYGVMMYVSSIFSFVFAGYTMGISPVISFHDGAKNYEELKSLLRKGLTLVGIFGVSMFAASQLLAYPLAKIFVGYDEALMKLTLSGFRIYAFTFLFIGFAVFGSSFFTALNDGITSAIISFVRSLIFQVAFVLILPLFWGVTGIWCSDIAAEVMAILLTIGFLIAKKEKYHY